MNDAAMNDNGQILRQTFEAIHRERMRDLPMINPALEVATVGFEQGDQGCLGVLITPWCMNLVLLPEGDEWNDLQPGAKRRHVLPSGTYEFVVADEPGLGRFQSCSLFSPMFEFGDQVTAIATGKAALLAVMSEAYSEREGMGQPLDQLGQSPDPDRSGREERARGRMSRRDLLRGEVFR